jgi:hypothetical protein
MAEKRKVKAPETLVLFVINGNYYHRDAQVSFLTHS